MKKYALLLCALFYGAGANAAGYKVDYAASRLAFSGMYAGKKFTGVFGAWQASIDFDAANLATSSIDVTIDTASAKTGDATYDATLPGSDWFAVNAYPQAHFASTHIGKNSDGSYKADGTLTLRGASQPVSFNFTLTDLSAMPVKAAATLTLDRLAFAIGQQSDAKAEWVDRTITIDIMLTAARL